MTIHDSFARTTPYELLLPREGFAEEWFPKIREEAQGRGGGLDNPEAFILLGEAAMALREIREERDPPGLIQQHGALLFQAFHFFEAGMPLYFLDTEVVRYMVEHGPGEGEWVPSFPGPAGYLQLPHHLIWTPGDEADPPESVDGIFWSFPDGESLTLLIAMGMRKDRPGLAVVPLPTLPLVAVSPWASLDARPDGDDFHSTLPGAELEGLYSVTSGAEALKLAMRIFWYLDVFSGRLVEVAGPSKAPDKESEDTAPDGPRRTGLPYRHIFLGEG